jgi:hypothetical protein
MKGEVLATEEHNIDGHKDTRFILELLSIQLGPANSTNNK